MIEFDKACLEVSGVTKNASELILASASPRRLELLQQIGVSCVVKPVNIPEFPLPDEAPRAFVERLAREKASAGLQRSGQGAVVLGADTVVVAGDRILGKPVSKQDAIEMLQRLSGDTHQVMTAVAVVDRERIVTQVVTTEVTFRVLSQALCERYWNSGEPKDKAGAYGIQGLGAVFVANIKGSYSAVVGLPLTETAALLDTFGIKVWQDSIV